MNEYRIWQHYNQKKITHFGNKQLNKILTYSNIFRPLFRDSASAMRLAPSSPIRLPDKLLNIQEKHIQVNGNNFNYKRTLIP